MKQTNNFSVAAAIVFDLTRPETFNSVEKVVVVVVNKKNAFVTVFFNLISVVGRFARKSHITKRRTYTCDTFSKQRWRVFRSHSHSHHRILRNKWHSRLVYNLGERKRQHRRSHDCFGETHHGGPWKQTNQQQSWFDCFETDAASEKKMAVLPMKTTTHKLYC